jgi:hypothetical protein
MVIIIKINPQINVPLNFRLKFYVNTFSLKERRKITALAHHRQSFPVEVHFETEKL